MFDRQGVDQRQPQAAADRPRKPWVRPTVQSHSLGSAEGGTQAGADFTNPGFS